MEAAEERWLYTPTLETKEPLWGGKRGHAILSKDSKARQMHSRMPRAQRSGNAKMTKNYSVADCREDSSVCHII